MDKLRMDAVATYFFNQEFRMDFLRKKGAEFENWFTELAGHAYGSDFEPVKAYGNQGDSKSDGRRVSTGTIFQCYAPDTIKNENTISKIRTDFQGAQEKWESFMKVWIFVTNSESGLPPRVIEFLDDLREKNPHIQIETWAKPELFSLFTKMSDESKRLMYGSVPTQSTINELSFQDIQPVIDALEQNEIESHDLQLSPPSLQKLEKNKLSEDAKAFLRIGRQRTHLVESYLQRLEAVGSGDRIAEAFRKRYSSLKDLGLSPDQIFGHLQDFANMNGPPQRRAATLAVVAYFFDSCDIFEDPEEEMNS